MSRSGYYRKPKEPEREEIKQEEAVIHCFKENDGNYGRIRIRKALLRDGIDVSEYRIARILKRNGLEAKSGRKGGRRTPKPTAQEYIEGNLIKDKFGVEQANALWCSDITELRCRVKMYLCGIIDVATRRLVGWAISKNQTQSIVQTSFLMAIGRNPEIPENAVFHSDRGCQYTAKRTKELVESNGFKRSMSPPGSPKDNQPIESFWRTLECELPNIRSFTFEQASTAIVKYVEMYYNSTRLHSGIDYNIPNEFFSLRSVRFS